MSGHPRLGGDAGLAWCHDALQDVSRTFSLTVETLDEPMATQICLGYLLCRIPDTIEDAGHIPPEEQAELMRTYGRTLDPDAEESIETFLEAVDPWVPAEDGRSDDWRVVAESTRVVAAFDQLPEAERAAILPPVMELVDGLAMFVDRHAETDGIRIDSRDELEEYCYYAAGTVGTLITNLLDHAELADDRRETMYETAPSFGRLLQLVNVAKDIHGDYTEENNVYLPKSWLEEQNVPQEAVLDPQYRENVAAVVDRTTTHAESFLEEAETYLRRMPLTNGNTLAAWGVPFLLAVGTIRELRETPAEALTEREVKVTREEVFAIVETMQHADRDDLPELRAIVANEPLHEASASVPSN